MPARPDLVRVRLENGAHKTLTAERAEATGLKPLKQSPTRRDGSPAPTKHRVSLGAGRSQSSTDEAPASEAPKEG